MARRRPDPRRSASASGSRRQPRASRGSSCSTGSPPASSPWAASSSSWPSLHLRLHPGRRPCPLFRSAAQGQPRGHALARCRGGRVAARKPLAHRHRRVPDVPLRALADGRFVFFRRPTARGQGGARSRPGRERPCRASRSLDRRLRGRGHRRRPRGAAAGPLPAAVRGAEARGPRASSARSRPLRARPGRRPVREVAYVETRGPQGGGGAPGRRRDRGAAHRRRRGSEQRETLRRSEGEKITRVRLGRTRRRSWPRPRRATCYHWELGPEPRLDRGEARRDRARSPPSSTRSAPTRSWSATRRATWRRGSGCGRDEDETRSSCAPTRSSRQGTAIAAIGASTPRQELRDRRRRRLARAPPRHLRAHAPQFPATGQPVDPCCITPKIDGILATQADGRLRGTTSTNPHPEVSWRALFGKVWYEGYAKPEYVWQSHGRHRRLRGQVQPGAPRLRHHQGHGLRAAVRDPARGDGRALHLAVHAPEHQGQDQAHGRDHGGAAERGGRLHRRPLARVAVERNLVPVLLMIVVLPAVRHRGRAALGPPARAACATGCAPGMEIALILPLLLLGALGGAPASGPRVESGSSSAATSGSGCRRTWASSTTSATAWWWASPWASPSSPSSSRSPRTPSPACPST